MISIILKCYFTKRRDRVVNTPASYSGGPEFRSRPRDRLSWLRFSLLSSEPPRKCRDSTLELDQDRFLLSPFQFNIHLSPTVLVKTRCKINYKNKLIFTKILIKILRKLLSSHALINKQKQLLQPENRLIPNDLNTKLLNHVATCSNYALTHQCRSLIAVQDNQSRYLSDLKLYDIQSLKAE
jgi:hypothetical protein